MYLLVRPAGMERFDPLHCRIDMDGGATARSDEVIGAIPPLLEKN